MKDSRIGTYGTLALGLQRRAAGDGIGGNAVMERRRGADIGARRRAHYAGLGDVCAALRR